MRQSLPTRTLRAALCAGTALVLLGAGENGPPSATRITVPADLGESQLKARRDAQFAAAESLEAFHFFELRDRQSRSGIDFVHRATDDAARDYKMVHYDHGNGLAAADVDGDGLTDLYFLSQLGSNALYRNLGGGRFEDVTAAAGVGLADRISVSASFADVDNDGDADLFVTTVRGGNVLFLGDGGGRFEDVTEAVGLSYSGHSSGATFFDFDRDGFLDLFVSNVGVYTTDERGRGGYWVGVDSAFSGHLFPERSERSLVYRNVAGERGRRFVDVSEEVGLVDLSWTGDSAFTDVDRDGFPELYVLNMQGNDHYYLNRGGRFEERTAETVGSTPWGAMGIATLDWNQDGRLDILVTDMHSDMTEVIGPEREQLKSTESVLRTWSDEHLQGGSDNVFGNAFFEGQADGSFSEISDRIGVENYWPWGASAGDLNADGWDDLVITASMNYQFRYAPSSILLNDRGRRFVASEFLLGAEPRPDGVSAPWFELDCDAADREHTLCEGRRGALSVWGAQGSRASVLLDLEGDGDLDLVTGEFHTAPRVLVSDLSRQTNLRSIEVELEGTRSNRDGLGAFVTVTAGDLRQTKFHNGKSGYLSQSSLPLYFGLGGNERVDRVEVLWPSGATQVVREGIEVGERLTLREP